MWYAQGVSSRDDPRHCRHAPAAAALPVRHRLVLPLRYLDGRAVPDLAQLLGTTVHGAESRLARARASLRAAYETEQETMP